MPVHNPRRYIRIEREVMSTRDDLGNQRPNPYELNLRYDHHIAISISFNGGHDWKIEILKAKEIQEN